MKELHNKGPVKEFEYCLRLNGHSWKMGFSSTTIWNIPLYFANNLFKVIRNRLEFFKRSIAEWDTREKSKGKLAVINLEKTKCQKKERNKNNTLMSICYVVITGLGAMALIISSNSYHNPER